MAFAILGLPVVLTITFFMVFCIITWAITKFILYIFQSFGLLNIARNENYKYPYIVWIPGISHYILGKFTTNNIKGTIYSILTIIKILLFISTIFVENSILFYTFLIYIIIYFIIDMLMMNKFYKKVYKQPQIFTVFTIITLGLLKPIFIYTVKIKKISNYHFSQLK